jgi:HEAT repeat protein
MPFMETPVIPPMPFLEGFGAGRVGQSEDPQVQFQQEVFRTLLRNSPERGLEIASERLKADPSDPVVIGNLSAIASSGSANAVPLLISIAKTSSNIDARSAAVSALTRNRNDKNSLAILQDVYSANADHAEVRRAVVMAMSRLADPQAVAAIAKIASSDSDDSVRRTAIQFLGTRNDPDSLKALEDFLRQPSKTPGFQ